MDFNDTVDEIELFLCNCCDATCLDYPHEYHGEIVCACCLCNEYGVVLEIAREVKVDWNKNGF